MKWVDHLEDRAIFASTLFSKSFHVDISQTLGPIAVKNSGPEAVDDFNLELETPMDDEYLHLTWIYGDDYQSPMEQDFLAGVSYALGS